MRFRPVSLCVRSKPPSFRVPSKWTGVCPFFVCVRTGAMRALSRLDLYRKATPAGDADTDSPSPSREIAAFALQVPRDLTEPTLSGALVSIFTAWSLRRKSVCDRIRSTGWKSSQGFFASGPRGALSLLCRVYSRRLSQPLRCAYL